MQLKEFSYHLPLELIAQEPVSPRDKARLMVVDRKAKTIHHDVFSRLPNYLPVKSIVVLNDSKVVPARILTKRKTGGQVEIFLLNRLEDGYSYKTMIRPLKRIKEGERIPIDGNGLWAELVDWKKRIIRFNKKDISYFLNRKGHMPLPPYIKRADTAADRKNYQTVYAAKPGSVAAPTAGLHFTQGLLGRLKKDGHSVEKVTLHVNYATFKPVEEEDITKHPMHTEVYSVSKKTMGVLENAKKKQNKIVAVGTTSCRVLETLAISRNLTGSTDIFIYPGYRFKMADVLITNFHLPFSTLLMLVYAFGGKSLMKKAYREAIKEKYRFFSYGDAMIIL